MGTAMLLEALQALTPDRCCDLQAAFYGVAGALAAALCADVFTRTHRLMSGGRFFIPQRFTLPPPLRAPSMMSSRRVSDELLAILEDHSLLVLR